MRSSHGVDDVVTSPLYAVLNAIEQADGPISLSRLSRDLSIEPAALQGMVDFWVRKGRLRVQDGGACSAGGCGGCKVGPDGCPLLLRLPGRYELNVE
jgi:hypothetical protein